MGKIGVAVFGASPLNSGWAVRAHIPAIQALPHFALRAVGTSRQAPADAAANAFGVPAFADIRALLAHPGVGLVVVAVTVPHHHALISAALDAGKMILSDWPLGTGAGEAEDVALRANRVGVRTTINLQPRSAPAVLHARALVANGCVGEVLATTLVGSCIAWAGDVDPAHAYLVGGAQGTTVLSVPTLHTLDAVHYVLGEFRSARTKSAMGDQQHQRRPSPVVGRRQSSGR